MYKPKRYTVSTIKENTWNIIQSDISSRNKITYKEVSNRNNNVRKIFDVNAVYLADMRDELLDNNNNDQEKMNSCM